MAEYTFLPPQNFLALPEDSSDFENSRALILPLPYETTTSYRGGTKNGPSAVLDASRQVELYDREFDSEPALEYGIHTLPALAPDLRSGEAAVASITAAVTDLARSGKLLVGIGGEHTVSVGMARGLHEVFGEFVTVQLDAHADLRDTFEETPYSHACAMRRISELGGSLVQLGLRSVDITEAEFLKANPSRTTAFFAEEMVRDSQRGYLTELAKLVQGKQVFLTIDMDVFDPSQVPSVGTPEPGGLFWYDVLDIVRTVAANGKIIAFDCVELAPTPGLHAPDFLTAKLIYKTLNLILCR